MTTDEESVNWRPGVKQSWLQPDAAQRHDLLGRRHPRRVTPATFLRGIGGLGARLSRIGGNAWGQDVNEDGITIAVVACPCGKAPQIEVGSSEMCACERYFVFDGESVWVGNSPVRNAATPAAS